MAIPESSLLPVTKRAKMEGELGTIWANLPEELMEKSLAMVPFPYVFQAPILCKEWLARFLPIATLEDKEKKCLATYFQEQMYKWSTTTWPTFCPMFLCKEDFMGYDRASQQWRRLPFNFLPQQFFTRPDWWQLEGPLLLVSTNTNEGNYPSLCNFFVANLLTQKWRQLPDHPNVPSILHQNLNLDRLDVGEKWLIRKSAQAYKVIVFNEKVFDWRRGCCLVDIFDSELGEWSSTTFSGSVMEDGMIKDGMMSKWAYLNGVFYRAVGPLHDSYQPTDLLGFNYPWHKPKGLLTFNVIECNFEILQMQMPAINRSRGWMLLDLVVCDGDLVMLVYDRCTASYVAKRVTVLKIDLVSLLWVKVTEGPPASLNFGPVLQRPASDGSCLFFSGSTVESDILTYNMSENQWSCLPMPQSVRQSLDLTHLPMPQSARQLARQGVRHLLDRTRAWNRFHSHYPDKKYIWEPSSFSPGLNPFARV